MKLRWMSFKNFRLFRQNYIDLSGVSLASIIGRYSNNWSRSNEAGKSTIGEGLMYLLFEYHATTSADELISWSSSDDTMEVEGEFEYEGQICRVKRTRKGISKQGVLKGNFDFYLNGEKQGKHQAEAKKMFSDFIGIDANIAFATWYFLQGEADKLTTSDPSSRKDYLASVLKADYDGAYNVAKTNLKKAQEALEQAKIAEKRSIEVSGQIAAAETNVSEAIKREAELSQIEQRIIGDISNVSRRLGEMRERAKSAQRLPELRKELAQINEWMSHLVKKANEAIQNSQNKVKELQLMESTHHEKAARLLAAESEIKAVKAAFVGYGYSDDPDEWIAHIRTKIGETTSKIDSLNRRLAEAEAATLMDWNGKTTCPTCGQPATADHLQSHFGKVKAAAVAISSEITSLVSQRETQEKELKSVKEACEYIKGRKSEMYSIAAANLEYAGKHETHMQSISFARQNVEQLQAEHKQYCERYELVSAEIGRLAAVGSGDELPQLEAEEAKLKTDQQNAVEYRMQQSSLITQWKQHVEALRVSKAEIDAMTSQIPELEKKVKIKAAVTELFHRDGLALMKVKQAAGLIQYHANTMLSDVLPDYSIKVVVDNQSGRRGILDFRVMTSTGEHSYASFSGGARKVIDICLRMSLSKILAEGSGRTFKTLFLDEVMADLDEPNREAMMKLIRSLSRSFASIYVISHEKEIQTAFPQVVLVERSGDSSQLSVLETSSI